MEKQLYEEMYRIEDSYWWFRGKRKIISAMLNKYAGENGKRILDVGCGTGANLEQFSRYGDLFGVDISMDALQFCKSRRKESISAGECGKLPFKKGAFDIVLAIDLIEHIDDEEGFLKEINRVLSDEGVFVFTTSAFSFLWSQHDVAAHHKRRYRRGKLGRLLEGSNFKVERLSYTNFFIFPVVILFRGMQLLTGGSKEVKTDFFKVPKIID